jgi:hypothetical protein
VRRGGGDVEALAGEFANVAKLVLRGADDIERGTGVVGQQLRDEGRDRIAIERGVAQVDTAGRRQHVWDLAGTEHERLTVDEQEAAEQRRNERHDLGPAYFRA